MRVLIAEDEAFTRLLLTKTLPQWGFEVEAVENGQDALETLLKPNGPAIAILDGYLPGKDGVSIVKEIREKVDLPFRHLLMLTARSSQAHRLEALSSGADAYLSKPIDLPELRAYLMVAKRQAAFAQKLQDR